MSIPKEPRQLMINIMYLVLTAMLALNVSAEIFNAFKIVDKGLIKSNKALELNNDAIPEAIRDGAKKTVELERYAELIDPARTMSATLQQRIDEIIDKLIDESGTPDGVVNDDDYVTRNGEVTTDLKGKKNKDVTTRLLVKQGLGEELKAELLTFRQEMIALADEEDRASFSKEIPDIVDDETWKKKYGENPKGDKNWSFFNFRQMPVQAVLPILRKFQNDVISTESAFLNYLAKKVGGKELVFDRFTVVSSPEKTYVINGETFSTEVFLSASASEQSNTGISLKVNGVEVPTDENGVGTFTQRANGVGKKTYVVEGEIEDPITGERTPFSRTYEYEVGERSAAISASKMNVFYIGVDNPVEVSVAGVPSNQVQVSMGGAGGGTINRNSDGTFNVNVSRPTKLGEFAEINLSAPGFNASKGFRVKRIPDPVPKLSKSRGGAMSSGEFKAQSGIIPALEGFDFDAKCSIVGFQAVRVPRRADPEISINKGGRYTQETNRIVNKAAAGDRFFFDNIKCKCPGDIAARDIGNMSFTIR